MGKILCVSDFHIRATNPRYRIDNYFDTMIGKLTWIFDLAKKEDCKAILQAGDFFDSPDQSNRVEIELIKLLRDNHCPLITIYGQHDCSYRRRDNTALHKFAVDELVNIAHNIPINIGGVYIYGASWEEEVSKVKNKEVANILIIHRMVTKDGPLWHDQQNYITAKEMLKKYDDFDLILSGDNHQHFTYGTKFGSILLNCGSLMRTTVAQRDHEPCAYIYNSITKEVVQHKIPIKPIEEVMNLEAADELKERNEALEAFMNGLNTEYKVELSFEDNLNNLLYANKTGDKVKEITHNFLKEWHSR